MSLHEELENLDLDLDRLSTAMNVVLAKWLDGGAAEHEDLSYALASRYGALAVIPGALADVYEADRPSAGPTEVAHFRRGAIFLASVLCEYAQLVEMQTQFPDAPRPE